MVVLVLVLRLLGLRLVEVNVIRQVVVDVMRLVEVNVIRQLVEWRDETGRSERDQTSSS